MVAVIKKTTDLFKKIKY